MTTSSDLLLHRGDDEHRPSVENRVAFQGQDGLDTLGHRTGTLRDQTIMRWLLEALEVAPAPRRVLDIGCSYGNHVLMLNALAGKPQDVELVGVDLYEPQLQYGQVFAATIPGFGNCSFTVADIEKGLPFPDDHFDVVNIADVLEHLTSPPRSMAEIVRVVKPGGTIVFSTPLKTGVFKSISNVVDRISRGRVKRAYYAGKGAAVVDGKAVMDVHAGHDHISEMDYPEMLDLAKGAGCTVVDARFMPVMSGSTWFDKHPYVMSGLMLLEAVHETLQRPSWAHGVVMRLRVHQ